MRLGKGCGIIGREQKTLYKAVGHMCRKVCRRAKRMGEEEDLKAMRDMVQLLKELSALIRDLEGDTESAGPRIRLEREVEEFAG